MKQFVALVLLVSLLGCGTFTAEKYSRDPMADIGNYPAAPTGFQKVRCGISPNFKDKTGSRIGGQASDQLETLVMRTGRFSLIDRTSLKNLLHEQGLEGIVDPNELAKPGRVRGVDYLFIGAITNFRVKVVKTDTGFGIGRITKWVAGVDIDTSKTVVETQVGVDIKLVNCTTGEIIAKDFGEVKREDIASSWGMRILSIGGAAKNELEIDADSKGKVLRWALDESLQKMIPMIDQHFVRVSMIHCPTCKVEFPASQKFCTKCGKSVELPKCAKCNAQLEPGAKFCGGCGCKVPK
jgi:curli biogenesis system outer membrane secretion channel CsgG